MLAAAYSALVLIVGLTFAEQVRANPASIPPLSPVSTFGPAPGPTGEWWFGDRFGKSVAISSDGNTALVGDTEIDGPGVSVFVRSGAGWVQQAQLTASGAGGFGCSVALSANGNVALVGAPGETKTVYGEQLAGSAWVFVREGQAWVEQAKLTPETAADPPGTFCASPYGGFGESVALSGEGSTALIGASATSTEKDGGHSQPGAAWVFSRTGGAWVQQGRPLTAKSDAGALGASVALSADGSEALIDEPFELGGAMSCAEEQAWVYTAEAGQWVQQGAGLRPHERRCSSRLGAVAISADGSTAVLDGRGENSAWVFTRVGSTWIQQGPRLTPEPDFEGLFGASAALSANGNVALVSSVPSDGCGKYDSGPCGYPGAVWVFARNGSTCGSARAPASTAEKASALTWRSPATASRR